MKINYLTTVIALVGITILFFFPEPETNFLAYIGTALFFIILTIFSIIWRRGKRNN